MIVNTSKAKANLSKLIDLAYHGEEVIIAKNNLPLVKLVAHKTETNIVLGLLAEKKNLSDDNIIEEDKDLTDLFYQGDIEP